MKLLSPAGDFESLKMAIFYGADEVYLGVKDFNARNIEGFSLTSLREAVDFAHIYGVKVHLAVNILFQTQNCKVLLTLLLMPIIWVLMRLSFKTWGLPRLFQKLSRNLHSRKHANGTSQSRRRAICQKRGIFSRCSCS